MVKIEIKETEKRYKQGLKIHYYRNWWTKLRPFLAILILASGILILMNSNFDNWIGIIFIFYGSYMIFKNTIYIKRSLNMVKTNKYFSDTSQIEITDDKINASTGESSSSTDIKKLYGYYEHKLGLHLYLQKNQYMYIQKEEVSAEDFNKIIEILKNNNVVKLK